ncbi:acyl carrier protein [Apibacter sp. B2966]|uniref:acyl carrier protein n=1 Tax=Apibacter sp. B2966 TaxID=2656761 RepID=UPI001407BCC5|nr:acyl carrier protein [Apibacter sp. B2966]QII72325.1 acyl carrier protein [Apibacter sp. B2966]
MKNLDNYNKVKRILSDYLSIDLKDFDMQKDLQEDYDVDSAERVEILIFLEKEFNVKIDRHIKDSWNTGKSIASYIDSIL